MTTTNPDLPSGPLAHDGDEPSDPHLKTTASQPALEPATQPSAYSDAAAGARVTLPQKKPSADQKNPSPEPLPDTVEALQALVLEQRASLAVRDADIAHMAKMIVDAQVQLHETGEELRAHREAVKDRVPGAFAALMLRAKELGVNVLTFDVTLEDYFPYPSPKKSWNCCALNQSEGASAGLATAEGRSGEEALREVILRLEERTVYEGRPR